MTSLKVHSLSENCWRGILCPPIWTWIWTILSQSTVMMCTLETVFEVPSWTPRWGRSSGEFRNEIEAPAAAAIAILKLLVQKIEITFNIFDMVAGKVSTPQFWTNPVKGTIPASYFSQGRAWDLPKLRTLANSAIKAPSDVYCNFELSQVMASNAV